MQNFALPSFWDKSWSILVIGALFCGFLSLNRGRGAFLCSKEHKKAPFNVVMGILALCCNGHFGFIAKPVVRIGSYFRRALSIKASMAFIIFPLKMIPSAPRPPAIRATTIATA